jgi:hypothetical protein
MLAISKHDLIAILRDSHFIFAAFVNICPAPQVIGGMICEHFGQ